MSLKRAYDVRFDVSFTFKIRLANLNKVEQFLTSFSHFRCSCFVAHRFCHFSCFSHFCFPCPYKVNYFRRLYSFCSSSCECTVRLIVRYFLFCSAEIDTRYFANVVNSPRGHRRAFIHPVMSHLGIKVITKQLVY